MKSLVWMAISCVAWTSVHPADLTARDARQHEKRLTQLIQTKQPTLLESFIKDMADIADPRTVKLIPPAALALPSAELYKQAVKELAELNDEKCVNALIAMLDSRKVRHRHKALVLDAFARRDDSPTLTAIVVQLESKTPHVQVAACRAAARRREREAIPVLIDLLAEKSKQHDRVWLECRHALVSLTGQNLDTPEDWKKYWAIAKDNFDPRRAKKPEGMTVVGKGATEFFGAEICSGNLIFVIDVSGSMLMYDDSETYTGRNPERDRQRLWRAQVQLARAIKRLPRKARFNIIAYADKLFPWKTRLQSASSSSAASAIRFVQSFRAKGGTHTDEALELAFKDPDVDTIILLSDGAPEKRDAPAPEMLIQKILDRLADLNHDGRIRINTFGFQGIGEWPEFVPWSKVKGPLPRKTAGEVATFIQFLQDIAEQNGGFFRAIN